MVLAHRCVAVQVKKKALSAFDRDRLLSNVIGVTSADSNWMQHFGSADVVIEAVPENLVLKHKVVRGGTCSHVCVTAFA